IWITGCASNETPEANGEGLQIVATTTMIADLARQIGGHRVAVKGIMAPGGDPHVYKPVPEDAQAISTANMVLVNGLHLEAWIDDLIANAGGGEKTVVTVTEGMPHRASPFDASVPDPHVWFDVNRWRMAAKTVATALAKADPAGATTYAQNATLYDRQLAELDKWVRQRVEEVPVARRKLVTSHDAFGYFGDAYGFTVVPVQGISTESEASTRDVVRVVEAVKEAGVPAIFVETPVNTKLIEQVARETNTRVGGALYSDSTGPLDSSGGSYIGMVRDNVSLIVEGLR
ncbi:MAG: metal ABC transporter substrate-binding protein, partial [Candidatus Sericytochromatia bacterium]